MPWDWEFPGISVGNFWEFPFRLGTFTPAAVFPGEFAGIPAPASAFPTIHHDPYRISPPSQVVLQRGQDAGGPSARKFKSSIPNDGSKNKSMSYFGAVGWVHANMRDMGAVPAEARDNREHIAWHEITELCGSFARAAGV